MSLVQPFPRAVNPELHGHVSSTQRRRERREKRRENPASQDLRNWLRLVHPNAARTVLVGQASACQSARSSDFFLTAVLFVAWDSLVFSALPLRSLRLCVEHAFSEWR